MKAYVVESLRPLYRHVGLMFTHPTGVQVVYANTPGRGVVRQSVDQFRAGQPFKVVRGAVGAFDQLLAKALSASGRRYDWATWNCEHFVSWAEGREPSSPQLQAYVGAAALMLLLWAGSSGKAAV